ncbi:MAG: hypothetical protein ACD_79C00866G0001 [uncultured bacterium]|nr:MAG: hypothetical protein ACD_79C00866G0001 [uncultured bacterium]
MYIALKFALFIAIGENCKCILLSEYRTTLSIIARTCIGLEIKNKFSAIDKLDIEISHKGESLIVLTILIKKSRILSITAATAPTYGTSLKTLARSFQA